MYACSGMSSSCSALSQQRRPLFDSLTLLCRVHGCQMIIAPTAVSGVTATSCRDLEEVEGGLSYNKVPVKARRHIITQRTRCVNRKGPAALEGPWEPFYFCLFLLSCGKSIGGASIKHFPVVNFPIQSVKNCARISLKGSTVRWLMTADKPPACCSFLHSST